jgi:hypothetical protein
MDAGLLGDRLFLFHALSLGFVPVSNSSWVWFSIFIIDQKRVFQQCGHDHRYAGQHPTVELCELLGAIHKLSQQWGCTTGSAATVVHSTKKNQAEKIP